MSDSQPKVDPALMMANLNTPRILELDINRMMIGQNTIRYVITQSDWLESQQLLGDGQSKHSSLQGSHRHWKTWKIAKKNPCMGNSWNLKNDEISWKNHRILL